jgi:hypothetical protein
MWALVLAVVLGFVFLGVAILYLVFAPLIGAIQGFMDVWRSNR